MTFFLFFPAKNVFTGENICRKALGVTGRVYTRGRIIRRDQPGQTFVTRLVIRLWYKAGHKTHYPSRRTIVERLERRRAEDSSRRIMRPLIGRRPFVMRKDLRN